MKLITKTTWSSLILLFPCLLFAQTGGIEGKVIEAESAYEVIGANLVLEELGTGVATDLDGKYLMKDIPVGNYQLVCSYLGFEDKVIAVVIEANTITHLDIKLGESPITTQTATVTASRLTNTASAVLSLKKESTAVLDGISATEISRSGDSDAAGAIKRITGVTIEGGKYVYVRGLGDRYGKTTLNGADIPGLDPNKNAIQMDLFPTNLIDNILVYKTFMPNLPGDFTGGYVDIATKDFPHKFTFSASASIGYNTQTTFNSNFLTQQGGRTDWLGFDDGTRALPTAVKNTTNLPNWQSNATNQFNAEEAKRLVNLTNAFSNTWEQQRQAVPFNQSLSLSLGDQVKLFGNPLGIIGALSYQRNYSFYENGSYGIYQLTGMYDQVDELNSNLSLTDTKGTEEVLWGAMLGASYKLAPTHKISLLAMHNQSATITARYLEGEKDDDRDEVFQTQSSQFLQRGLTTIQLGGKHVFMEANKLEVSWKSSYANSTQSDPDLRYFTNRYDSEWDAYTIKPSSDRTPSRFYRDMQQANWSNKVDFVLPFSQWSGQTSKFKAGFAHTGKSRSFDEKRYSFESQYTPFDGSVANYFQADNLLQYDADQNRFADNGNGIYIINALDSANIYSANQMVLAGYAMVELPLNNQWSITTGARVEYTTVQLTSASTKILETYPALDGQTNLLENTDILPSVILNYEPTKKMKIRAAYARTLARPSFRELAPFNSFDVEGGYILVGNPDVQRTLIDNVDLRWEYYVSTKELLSVSAFYKHFNNPIERTFNIQAQNPEITFRNVDQASLAGIELEARKHLGFITPALEDLMIGTNFSYIYSVSQIDEAELEAIRATNPNAADTRQMFGQSPYTLNSFIGYNNKALGLNCNLVFNVSGPKIAFISVGGTPNTYIQPRPTLNFNITKEIVKNFSIKFAVNNLLNTPYQEVIHFKDRVYEVYRYDTGIDFSLGIKYNFSKL